MSKLVQCPVCQEGKTNIKRYYLFDQLIFIGIGYSSSLATVTCCASCMRQWILRKTFGWMILTANLIWIFMALPWHLLHYLLSFITGHSDSIETELEE